MKQRIATKLTGAGFLNTKFASSDVRQNRIAKQIGYDHPNVLTMFKQGKTKLPLNKVGPLAKALQTDPMHLLRLVMSEYMPETWESLQDLVGTSLVTRKELELLQAVRLATGGHDLIVTGEVRNAIFDALNPIAERAKALNASVAQIVAELPANKSAKRKN